jgi:Thoeris protein ThsB, TIR-like domain
MPALYQYRLFISHAWDYHESYNRLVEMLNNAPNFIYSNYSVPKSEGFKRMSAADLRQQLKNQINPTQCAIILGGMWVSHSDWIQFEIDHAATVNKPILGIKPWGAERMPQALTNAAKEIVGWNTDSIVSAIRRLVP